MTDFAADAASGTAETALTARTGTASSDTVPGGSYVVWRNTGAGSHTVTLTNNLTQDGLSVSSRIITIPAGQVWGGRVNPAWSDSAGRVGVAINGTASEVVYYVIGGI